MKEHRLRDRPQTGVALVEARIAGLALVFLLLSSGCSRRTDSSTFQDLLAEGRSRQREGEIVFHPEPWIEGWASGCESAYLDFLARHSGREEALGDEELSALLAAMDRAPKPERLDLDAKSLGRRILQGLSISDLLVELDERPLMVAVLEETSGPGLLERRLLFGDPEVGSFEGLLLMPSSPGPHPAVIGLHGHRHDSERFAAEFLGRELASQGFVVLVPELRAHDCSLAENKIATALLKGGRTLMGLRVYEVLLMAKYLQHTDAVDAARIGLLGHSGGSSVADLAVFVSDAFAAKVTDYQPDYRDRCGPRGVHCETLPGLFPLAVDIMYRTDPEIPWLVLPYRFKDPSVRRATVTFFQTALSAPD